MKSGYVIVIIFCFFLLACGGGGSDKPRVSSAKSSDVLIDPISSTSHPSASSSSIETISSVTGSAGASSEIPTKTFTPSLTSESAALDIASTIVKFESPITTARVGETVSVFDNNGENIIFATDDSGEVILIGDGSEGLMGVESTAKYLSLIGLLNSDNPADLPWINVRPYLYTSSTFGALVATVKSELEKGIPLSQSEVIGEHVSKVVLEAQITYAQASIQELVNSSPKATKTNSVPKLDYYILDEAADEKFWISNGDKTSVTINNRTYLHWSTKSVDLTNGTSLSEPIIIPPLETVAAQLIALYLGSESKTNIPTKLRTEITIGQSKESINTNAVQLLTRSTFALVDFMLIALKPSPNYKQPNIEKCVISLTDTITTKPSFVNFVANPSVAGFTALLQSSADVFQPIAECAGFEVNFEWYKSLNRILAPFRAARSVNSAFGTLNQLIKYNNRNYTFELCRYAELIGPCVRRLSGPLEVVEVKVDETASLQINAFGDDDISIPTPSLTISSSDSSVVTVDPINSLGAITLKGVSAGSAKITATDPVTGVEVEKPIDVIVGACPESGNKLLGRPGTTSTPIYVGSVANVTDGSTGTNVNFSTSSGELTIDLGTQRCFSRFEIVFAVSPSSNVSYTLKFLDSSGQEIRAESISVGSVQGDTLTVSSFPLADPVYGVASLKVYAANSVSWVSLYEIRGF